MLFRSITKKDVADIYSIRALLEGLCARWATDNISATQMQELEENVYLSEFHVSKGHAEQIANLDNRFHEILYEACDSKMLEHLLRDFHQYVYRYRKLTLAQNTRSNESNKEHHEIMEAMKAKDGELAAKLANNHMLNAYQNMLNEGLVN